MYDVKNSMVEQDMIKYKCEPEVECETATERRGHYLRLIFEEQYSKWEAWGAVFGVDLESMHSSDLKAYRRLRGYANKYHNSKEVQNDLTVVQSRVHSLFADKHIQALEKQFEIATTARSEKVRADALHQFIQNTRNPHIPTASNEDLANASVNRKLLDTITQAFQQVNGNHIYIDAEVENPHEDAGRQENTPHRILPTSKNLQADTDMEASNMPHKYGSYCPVRYKSTTIKDFTLMSEEDDVEVVVVDPTDEYKEW